MYDADNMKSDKMSSGEVGQIQNFLLAVGIEMAGRGAPPRGGDRVFAPRTHARRCGRDALPWCAGLPGDFFMVLVMCSSCRRERSQATDYLGAKPWLGCALALICLALLPGLRSILRSIPGLRPG